MHNCSLLMSFLTGYLLRLWVSWSLTKITKIAVLYVKDISHIVVHSMMAIDVFWIKCCIKTTRWRCLKIHNIFSWFITFSSKCCKLFIHKKSTNLISRNIFLRSMEILTGPTVDDYTTSLRTKVLDPFLIQSSASSA